MGTEVIHLNRACTYPDLSNLFVRADVTDLAKTLEQKVPKWISEQTTMLHGPLPDVATRTALPGPLRLPLLGALLADPKPVTTEWGRLRTAVGRLVTSPPRTALCSTSSRRTG
jgi:hypothetical protein